MTPALVPAPQQTRTDRGVGASSAAAAIGVSDYRGPIDAWLEATGRTEPFSGNEKTWWGQALEPVIRAHYVEKNGVTVFVPPESLFHRELPWLRATPDGIVLDDRNQWQYVGPQVKNIGLRMAPAWADGTPPDYLIQGVVEMAVTELPRIDFAVLIGGQEYREFTLWRDGELEADVRDGLEQFWDLVQTDTQPAIDDSKTYREYLLKKIDRRQVVTIAASDDVTKLLDKWKETARRLKVFKEREKQIKNDVLGELVAAKANRLTSAIGDITIGNGRRETGWKEVAVELAAMPATMLQVERELVSLRADLSNEPGGELYTQRIDGLRGQLRLAGGMNSFDEIVARHTSRGAASINRPRSWTKDVDDEEWGDE